MRQIHDREELEAALRKELFLLFKHSPICPVSARAMAEYEKFVAEHRDVATGWIDVIDQREWSQWVAAETGVAHASPQALLVRAGAVVWSASHFDITAAGLAAAL